jgi:hypothetical protein
MASLEPHVEVTAPAGEAGEAPTTTAEVNSPVVVEESKKEVEESKPVVASTASIPATTSNSLAPTSPVIKAMTPINLVNRADQSHSPYVRAHADDLVAWQIWDDEMMELAKKSGRVVFLSIGYSACHCKSAGYSP